MSEPVTCPVCGGQLEGPWVRFHYAEPYTDPETAGHYVDGTVRTPPGVSLGGQEADGMAPAPPERLKLPKGVRAPLEDEVRWSLIDFMRRAGYCVYNMEQGHRPGRHGTRVGRGVPDVYFQGHGCTGWVELKRPDGKTAREKQTEDQKAFEREELANGGIYLLVESVHQFAEWHIGRIGAQREIGI